MKNAVPKNDKKRRKQLVEDVAKLEREMEQRHKEELEQLKLALAESKVWGTPLVSEPWESRLSLVNSLLCPSSKLGVESRHAATPTHHSSSLLVSETKSCSSLCRPSGFVAEEEDNLELSAYWLGPQKRWDYRQAPPQLALFSQYFVARLVYLFFLWESSKEVPTSFTQ